MCASCPTHRGVCHEVRRSQTRKVSRPSGPPSPTAQEALIGEADGERGITLVLRVGGERALPVDRGMVVLSPGRLCRHLLVCGATGSGKTETVLRLAWTLAKASEAPVFYLDGKGDRETASRFCALMEDAGRRARVFPNEPFDGWRGQPHEIQGRLMEIIDYSSEGPAAWYRDVAKNVLRLVCEHPEGPPRSPRTVLARMEIGELREAHEGSSALEALTADHVRQVRLRYEAFFGQTRGALDGEWAWEDTNAAYLLLDSLALREETSGLARFLFEDFAHYFTTRKSREQFAVLIVDEFSALAQGAGMAARIEQARRFHTGLVLAPQVVQGMGDENEAARITGSVETVICHRVNTPEEIVQLAGTRQRMEYRPTTGRRAAPAKAPPGCSTSTRSTRTRSGPRPGRGIHHQPRSSDARTGLRAPDVRSELPEIARLEDSDGVPDPTHAAPVTPGGPDRPHESRPAATHGGQEGAEKDSAESVPFGVIRR